MHDHRQTDDLRASLSIREQEPEYQRIAQLLTRFDEMALGTRVNLATMTSSAKITKLKQIDQAMRAANRYMLRANYQRLKADFNDPTQDYQADLAAILRGENLTIGADEFIKTRADVIAILAQEYNQLQQTRMEAQLNATQSDRLDRLTELLTTFIAGTDLPPLLANDEIQTLQRNCQHNAERLNFIGTGITPKQNDLLAQAAYQDQLRIIALNIMYQAQAYYRDYSPEYDDYVLVKIGSGANQINYDKADIMEDVQLIHDAIDSMRNRIFNLNFLLAKYLDDQEFDEVSAENDKATLRNAINSSKLKLRQVDIRGHKHKEAVLKAIERNLNLEGDFARGLHAAGFNYPASALLAPELMRAHSLIALLETRMRLALDSYYRQLKAKQPNFKTAYNAFFGEHGNNELYTLVDPEITEDGRTCFDRAETLISRPHEILRSNYDSDEQQKHLATLCAILRKMHLQDLRAMQPNTQDNRTTEILRWHEQVHTDALKLLNDEVKTSIKQQRHAVRNAACTVLNDEGKIQRQAKVLVKYSNPADLDPNGSIPVVKHGQVFKGKYTKFKADIKDFVDIESGIQANLKQRFNMLQQDIHWELKLKNPSYSISLFQRAGTTPKQRLMTSAWEAVEIACDGFQKRATPIYISGINDVTHLDYRASRFLQIAMAAICKAKNIKYKGLKIKTAEQQTFDELVQLADKRLAKDFHKDTQAMYLDENLGHTKGVVSRAFELQPNRPQGIKVR